MLHAAAALAMDDPAWQQDSLTHLLPDSPRGSSVPPTLVHMWARRSLRSLPTRAQLTSTASAARVALQEASRAWDAVTAPASLNEQACRLVDALSSTDDLPQLRTTCGSITRWTDARALVDAGALPALHAVLASQAHDDAALAADACNALCALVTTSTVRVAAAPAVPTLVSLLFAHMAHPSVLLAVLQALVAVTTRSDSNCAAVVDAGGVGALDTLLRLHGGESQDVAREACCLLDRIAATGAHAGVARAALRPMLAAMRDHAGDAAIAEHTCSALINMTAGEEGAAVEAVACGALDALMTVLLMHGGDDALLAECACWGVQHLAVAAVNRPRALPILPCIITALINHAHSTGVRLHAAAAVMNITCDTRECAAAAANAGAIHVLADMVRVRAGTPTGCGDKCAAVDVEVAEYVLAALGCIAAAAADRQECADAVHTIVDVMAAHAGQAGVTEQGCAALIRIFAGDRRTHAAVAVEAGAVRVITAALNAHGCTHAGVTENGCRLLGIIADNCGLISTAAVASTITALTANMYNPAAAGQLCEALIAVITSVPSHQSAAADAGGVEVLCELLHVSGCDDPQLAVHLCTALSRISRPSECRARCAAAIAPIMAVMKAHPRHASVATASCRALARIMMGMETSQVAAAAAGAAAVFATTLRAHGGGDAAVAASTCWALGVMACAPGARSKCAAAVAAVTEVMRAHAAVVLRSVTVTRLDGSEDAVFPGGGADRASVLLPACFALANMTHGVEAHQVEAAASGSIPLLRKCVQSFAGYPHMEEYAIAALASISCAPSARRECGAALADIVAVVTQSSLHEPAVIKRVCAALINATTSNAENQARALVCGVVPVLVSILQQYAPAVDDVTAVAIVERACRAFINVAVLSANCAACVPALTPLTILLTSHKQHAAVCIRACDAITNITAAMQAHAAAATAAGAPDALATVVRTHLADAVVTLAACRALRHVTRAAPGDAGDSVGMPPPHAARAAAALIAALAAHSGSAEIVHNACSALRNIITNSAAAAAVVAGDASAMQLIGNVGTAHVGTKADASAGLLLRALRG